MDIEFPVGTKFGVEKVAKGGSSSSSKKRAGGKLASAMEDDSVSAMAKDLFDTSDRELARLFVEMFQPLGGEHISVVFGDAALADIAASNWKGDLSAECRVFSLNKAKKKKAAIKGMGLPAVKGMGGPKKKKVDFASRMNEEFSDEFKLPDDCEVALFVAPTAKDLITVNKICADVGMGTLVILLNARLDLIENFESEEAKDFFENEFEKVFYLSIAPQDAAPGCLMHRAYPTDWIVARKPKVGPPKTIATFEKTSRPTDDECREAYGNVKVGDMEKGVENILENVATWLN